MEDLGELEEQISEASSELIVWKSFMEHAGWKILLDRLGAQMNIRKGVVMCTPLNPDSNIYAQEFLKGEFSGVQSVFDFPQNQLEEAKRLLSLLNVKVENYHEADRSSKPAKSRVDTDEHFGG